MKKINQKGFSIIEVLIVLAIAGLIMLIVFLAVPALQRSARNNSRQSDASKFSAAIQQCLSNNNGKYQNCNTSAAVGSATGISWTASEYGQLTTQPTYPTALTSAGVSAAAATDKATWIFGFKCDGADIIAATPREFAVVYKIEGSGTPQACIGS
jgi:prepilin-type N-terminal cleavage/methylation domain-containing protein